MKRRSAAVAGIEGKRGRPIKRNPKIADNFFGGSLVYVKLLLLWALVIFSDYFLEFRFEYLWPFWLFLRSVYDSFKYQGLAFSVFFICIAITSDMICFLFIPVHWLFFVASTYVWVQYVWHTEKGVCVPTVALWLVFVYVEAAIRLREFKAHVDLRHLPFHMDLCRPFAAHCIGYPVVTLGFGFKSYVSYRMRQRKQKEVQKTNEYYFEFLREALPPGQVREEAFNPHPSPKSCIEDSKNPDNGILLTPTPGSTALPCNGTSPMGACTANGNVGTPDKRANGEIHHDIPFSKGGAGGNKSSHTSSKLSNGVSFGDLEYLEKASSSKDDSLGSGHNDDGQVKKSKFSGKSETGGKKKMSKDDTVSKLEQDVKRLRADLQQSRNKENDLRDQIISYMSGERHLKSEISNLQVEKSVLESRLSGLLSTRAGEKATLSALEKKLADERRQKAEFQIKLETERKSKKEAANAERSVREHQTRSEVLKLEAELKTLRHELQTARERCQGVEQELMTLRKSRETHGDPEVLMKALKGMQEKNKQIENSLASETKLKMDLFSALSEAKKEINIKQGYLTKKDREISELKTKIAEVLAVMPHHHVAASSASSTNNISVSTAGSGLSNFAPTTLSLDLPASTDLSFTGKLGATSLGLASSDFDVVDTPGDLGFAFPTANSTKKNLYSPQANGKVSE